MTLTNDELVKRLAGMLQKPENEVSEELKGLVHELNEKTSKGEDYTIEGIGTFRLENNELVYEPDTILAIEINHKYAGMEDIEILGPDKDGKDEEIERKEKEDKSDNKVENDDEWAPIHFDDPNVSDLTEFEDEAKKGKNGNGKQESEIKEQLDEVKRKVRQLESDEDDQNEEDPYFKDSEVWDDSAKDDDKKTVYEGNQEDDSHVDDTVTEEPVTKEPKEEKPPKKKKKKKVRRRSSIGEKRVSGSAAIIVGIVGVFFVVGLVWVLVTYNGNQPNANVLLGENAPQTQDNNSNTQPQQQNSQSSSGNNQNNGGGLFANPQPGSSNSSSKKGNAAKKSNSQSMRMKTSSPKTNNQTPTPPPINVSSNSTDLFGLKGDLSPNNTNFYTIVVYSLTDHKRAEEVRNNLSSQNYRVSLSRSRLNDQYIYRVGLGQFKNTASAEQAAKSLPSKFRDNHFIKHVHLKSTNE